MAVHTINADDVLQVVINDSKLNRRYVLNYQITTNRKTKELDRTILFSRIEPKGGYSVHLYTQNYLNDVNMAVALALENACAENNIDIDHFIDYIASERMRKILNKRLKESKNKKAVKK